MTVGSLSNFKLLNSLHLSAFQLLELSQSLFKLSLIGICLLLLLAFDLFVEFVEPRVLLFSYQSINLLLLHDLDLLEFLLLCSLLIESCLFKSL